MSSNIYLEEIEFGSHKHQLYQVMFLCMVERNQINSFTLMYEWKQLVFTKYERNPNLLWLQCMRVALLIWSRFTYFVQASNIKIGNPKNYYFMFNMHFFDARIMKIMIQAIMQHIRPLWYILFELRVVCFHHLFRPPKRKLLAYVPLRS